MSTTRKVLFTSHTANFSKFNQPFMHWFKAHGYEVHYASAGEERVLGCDKHYTVPFERSPLKIDNLRAIRRLKKIIDSENYDIIHTHTPMGSVVTRLAAIKARKNGTRVIYTAHGFHFYKGASLINWLVYYPIEKIMSRYTDALVTINEEDYDRSRRKFKTDVRYIPGTGVDFDKFNISLSIDEKNELRKSLGLSPDDFVMIYTADLRAAKNQLWLIKSLNKLAKQHPDIHLLLVGKDSLGGKCQKLTRELGLENNIHFLGYRNDIAKLLQISNLAISTSVREGLPVNIMEAMSINLPVVATNCRGNRDLIETGKNGHIIQIGDSAALASIIEEYVNGKIDIDVSRYNSEKINKYKSENVIEAMKDVYYPKTRILHLLSSDKLSGAENVACELIKHTNSDNYEVVYCSPDGQISESLKTKNISYLSLKSFSFFEIKKAINNYRPDIIHAHDFKASMIASLFNKKARIISQIHQNPDWLHYVSIRSVLYHSCVNRFEKIAVVSKSIANASIFRRLRNKLVLVYNFVDSNEIIAKSEKMITKKYDVVFCGRLENVKNPLEFIRIISQVKQKHETIRAVMIGDGSLMNQCKTMINELELEKNIELVGFVDNPYPYMKNSKSLVITSKNEGFGLVAVEASLLGLSVFSYDIPSVKELFVGDHNIGDGQFIVKLITKMLNDSSTMKNALSSDLIFTAESRIAIIGELYKKLGENK